MKNHIALTLLLAICSPAAAEFAAPEKISAKRDISGTYEIKNEYAQGSVTVRQFSLNGTENAAFILSTVAGPAAHTADISGVAVQTYKGDFAFSGENGCVLSLKAVNGTLTVAGANATCGAYMGLNAAADGEYKKTDGYLAAPLDGSYSMDTGYTQGDLEVREFLPGPDAAARSLGFAVSSVSGPNAHTADISGVAVETYNGDFAFSGENGCELRLKPQNGAVLISDNGSCGAYMGMNAAVAGNYLRAAHAKAVADESVAIPLQEAKTAAKELEAMASSLKGSSAPGEYLAGVEESSAKVKGGLALIDAAIKAGDHYAVYSETILLDRTISVMAGLARAYSSRQLMDLAVRLERSVAEIRLNAPFAF